MKILLPLVAFLGSIGISSGATAYWSFQNAGATTHTTAVTYHTGFASAPSYSIFAGTGGATTPSGGHGAGQAYTEPTTSTPYVGGYASYWDGGSTNTTNLTGAGFGVVLNMTGLSDMTMRFDIRAAAAGEPKTGVPSSFATINYRLAPGDAWTASGLTYSTWSVTSGNFEQVSQSLAGLDAIEGQSYVELQFVLNGGPKASATQAQNVRVDNLQFTAIPEPSSVLLLSSLAGLVFLRRRN